MSSKGQSELIGVALLVVAVVLAAGFAVTYQAPAGEFGKVARSPGCTDGELQPCGTNIGECVSGYQTCTKGVWGSCEGAVEPAAEICDNLDNDCDGVVDEDGICENQEESCISCEQTELFLAVDKVYNPLIQERFRETQEQFEIRRDYYERYLKGDESVKQQDFIAVTRWAGPEGTNPLTKSESETGKTVKPFNVQKIENGKPSEQIRMDTGLVYVIVDGFIYNDLQTEISTFVTDLENDGYAVELYNGTYGTPEDLRSFLQQGLPDIKGAILIGDIPAAWFVAYQFGYEEFPIDLFYMDLDGEWTINGEGIYINHAGNTEAEIWIGRIDATTLEGSTIDLYSNYFHKNHLYRTGDLKLPNSALAYVDDDWYGAAEQWNNDLRLLYNYTQLVRHKGGTNYLDYSTRLLWNHEWISVFAHSWPEGNCFNSKMECGGSCVYSEEIEIIDPHGLFYNLFACSAAKFSEYNYIAGRYLFADTYGIAVVGSTKTGSMLEFDQFYEPLGSGDNLGDSFKEWFNVVGINNIDWHYGMVLLGDPTLKPNKPNNIPIAHINNIEDYDTLRGTAESNMVEGTAKRSKLSTQFDSFTLSIGSSLNPISWSSKGINASYNGLVEIDDDVLADIDTTQISENLNVLKLTVISDGIETNYKMVTIIDNVILDLPNKYFSPDELIIINGSAYGTYFSNYTIEWGTGEAPTEWSSENIEIYNNGQEPIEDATLGTLNASVMNNYNYVYTLRLSVFFSDGSMEEDNKTIIVDPDYLPGYPKKTNTGIIHVHPALVYDVTGNGNKEIIFQEIDGQTHATKIHVLDAVSGENIYGWPLVNLEYYGDFRGVSSADDINNDGVEEIVFNSYSKVRCYNSYGVKLWESGIDSEYHFNPESIPIIADLNNDGSKEIIVIAFPGCGSGSCSPYVKLFVFESNGDLMWSKQMNKFYFHTSPVVGDVNKDGYKEIFLGGINPSYEDSIYHLIDHEGNEKTEWGWPITTTQHNAGTFLMADVNNDGNEEMLFTEMSIDYMNGTIHVWNYTGENIEGWPVINNKGYIGSIIASDLDNDGNLEVIVNNANVTIYNNTGNLIEEYNPPLYWTSNTEKITADIDSDGIKELFSVGNAYPYCPELSYLYALDDDGRDVTNWPKIIGGNDFNDDQFSWHYAAFTSPIVTDINNDGKIDIVLSTDEYIFAWTVDEEYDISTTDWPMLRHDPEHTSSFTNPLPEPSEDFIGYLNILSTQIILENQATNINAVLINKLQETVSTIMATLYYKNTTDQNYTLLGEQSLGSLNPDMQITTDFVWNPEELGEYNLKLVVNGLIINGSVNDEDVKIVQSVLNSPDITGNIGYIPPLIENQTQVIITIIRNEGNVHAENSTAELYYKQVSDSSFNLIEERYLGIIDPQSAIEENFVWTPTEEGTYYLKLVVSCNNDSNQLNNEDVDVVYVTRDGADLSGSLEVWGETFVINVLSKISASLYNDGTKPATESEAFLFHSTDNFNYNLIDSVYIGTIGINGYEEIQFEWTPQEVGTNYLKYVVYSPDDINADNDESNYYVEVKLPGPDATGYFSYFWPPKKYVVNELDLIKIKVRNLGIETAENVTATIYVNDEFLDEIYVGDVDIEEIFELDVLWTPQQSGENILRLVIDSLSDVDTSNNEAIDIVNVLDNGIDVTGRYQWNSYKVGTESEIRAYVMNQGNETAENVTATIYLYQPDQTSSILIQDYTPYLTYDIDWILTYMWTPTQTGEHVLSLELDNPEDLNYSNNIVNFTIDVFDLINVTFHVTNSTDGFVNRTIGYGIVQADTVFDIDVMQTVLVPNTNLAIAVVDFVTYGSGYYTLFLESQPESMMRVISERYRGLEIPDKHILYSIYANNVSWDYYNGTYIVAVDDVSDIIPSGTEINIYTCSRWNFQTRRCRSHWKAVDGIYMKLQGDYLMMQGYADDIEAFAIGKQYTCGNANSLDEVDVDDVTYLINYIFTGGPAPIPIESADADLSGNVDIDDIIYLINYIFLGGPAPCSPPPSYKAGGHEDWTQQDIQNYLTQSQQPQKTQPGRISQPLS